MKSASLMIALCVAGAAFGGLAISRVASAQGDAGDPPTTYNPPGPLERLQNLLQDRSRDEHSSFDFVYLNDEDIALGRRYLILQGNIIEPATSSSHFFVATAEHVMDIRTLTYRGSRADGSLFFLKNFGELPINEALRVVIPFDDSSPSTTIHFDPPIRIERGDVILASMQRTDPVMAGIGLFSLHATVPVAGGGDILRVE